MLEVLKTYQYFLDDLPFGIFWRDKDFVYLGCNKFHAQYAGMSQHEIVGKTDYDLCWAQMATEHLRDDQYIINTSKKITRTEELITYEGKKIWLKITKLPLIHNNETIGIICFWQDITTLSNLVDSLTQALSVASQKASHTEKMILEHISMENGKI
jgi:PAS domain S-box-containing protein